MQKRKQDPISRTKGKLRRLLAGGESSTLIDQAPAVSNHEHTQLDPSSAQAPPAVELPPSNHIHDDARTGRPAVATPIGKPSIPTFQNPGPSQSGASSARFLEAAPPTLEAVNQSSPAPNRATFNLPESTGAAIDRPAWSGLKALRGVLRKSADVFGPLKSAIDGLSQCVEIFENEAAARQEYAQLRNDLNCLCQDISGFFDGGVSPSMAPSITAFALRIDKEVEIVTQKSQRSAVERYAGATEDADEIVECYRRIQMHLVRLSLNANINMWKLVDEQTAEHRLDRLPQSVEAKYRSTKSDSLGRGRCSPNTRADVLAQLRAWAQDQRGQKIYWLNGMAGTGKTTIAYSLCEQLQADGKLAASFFCSRQLPTCRDVSRILPSIAYQLSLFSLPFRHSMLGALAEQPDAYNQPVDLQFDTLIAAPLRRVRDTLPIDLVIVIDALDECEDSSGVSKMLFTLLQNCLDLPMKVFVTSRPEELILYRMESETYKHLRSELRLHELDCLAVQSDIRTYLTVSLSGLNLSVADLDTLTERSGVLFVYASTVVRYVTYNPTRGSQRLAEVLSTPASLDSSKQGVDPLYTAILRAALEDDGVTLPERTEMNLVLRTVICAREPLSVNLIARLLGTNKVASVHAALRALSSVLQVSGAPDQLVTTLHQSFPDFMLDQRRSGRFHCQPNEHHAWYAQTCFNLIKKASPAFNICQVESSYIPNREIVGVDDRIDGAISPQLFYVCRYWQAHVELTEASKNVVDQVVGFLSTRLLLWMEVMSLKASISHGVGMLLKLQAWLRGIRASSEIQDLAVDALRFMTAYASGPVCHLLPHIYLSTLALWPKQRPISKLYLKGFPYLAGVSGTAIDRQSAAPLAVLNVLSEVLSVACSPDNTTIAAGSADHAVHIWDAYTGEIIGQPLKGHSDWVQCVAYSPDGSHLISGSDDNTIRIWDTRTGQTSGQPLQGHRCYVSSVAYSPSGAHIISGSFDTIIRIWDVQTGRMLGQPLEGHTDAVYSVAYSPNGAYIVSGSGDRTIRVWDTQTRRQRGQPLEGHTDGINTVAYSPDGAYIASGSDDNTVCIWDAETGEMSTEPLEGHTKGVWSVAYSPDGARIVSGSDDNTICIWDAGTGQMLGQPLRGHTNWVRSVSFSPDGLRIISGSWDNTIRIWDAHIEPTPEQPPEGHTEAVYSVACSPDGSRIASGSEDHAICIWDAYTGLMVGQPLKGHTSYVFSVAYSLNGTRVASGSEDGMIRIWNASSGQMVGQSVEGHTEAVFSVAFSPDGSRIASGSADDTVRIWDAHAGQMVGQPLNGHRGTVFSVAFSPDGVRIVSGSGDHTIFIWDANTGKMVGRPLKGHTNWVRSVTYSPSGNHIVSGSDDKTIRIWDARTGEMVGQPLEGHTNRVMSVAYSAAGARIVSGSADGTVRIWDVHTSQMLGQPLEGHTHWVPSVAYSPDGKHIVSGSYDKSIRIWDVCALSNSGENSPDNPNLIRQPCLSSDIPQPISSELDTSSRIVEPRTDIGFCIQPSPSDPDAWTLSEDGWVVGRDLKPLLWVPPELRNTLLRYGNTCMISTEGSWSLDLSKAKFGTEWHECYRP